MNLEELAKIKRLYEKSNEEMKKSIEEEFPEMFDTENETIRKELASIEFMGVNDARDTETIARHFYNLGQQSKEQPVCEGFRDELDEAASIYTDNLLEKNTKITPLSVYHAFIDGSQWQKDQKPAEHLSVRDEFDLDGNPKQKPSIFPPGLGEVHFNPISSKQILSNQKPVEWHPEDEQNLNVCLSYIKDEPLRSWLIDAIHVRYDKPAEWSEGDEKTIHLACEFIRHHATKNDSIGGIDCPELVERLKSLPHRNPTKEQPVSEGFDGEFSKFSNDVDAEHPFPICVDEYKDFARHFYELGRQSKEEDVIIQKARTEKQRVLVTETDGNANVFWDARSLDDVKALLICGLDFIKKQSKEQPVCEGLEEEMIEFEKEFSKIKVRDGFRIDVAKIVNKSKSL